MPNKLKSAIKKKKKRSEAKRNRQMLSAQMAVAELNPDQNEQDSDEEMKPTDAKSVISTTTTMLGMSLGRLRQQQHLEKKELRAMLKKLKQQKLKYNKHNLEGKNKRKEIAKAIKEAQAALEQKWDSELNELDQINQVPDPDEDGEGQGEESDD